EMHPRRTVAPRSNARRRDAGGLRRGARGAAEPVDYAEGVAGGEVVPRRPATGGRKPSIAPETLAARRGPGDTRERPCTAQRPPSAQPLPQGSRRRYRSEAGHRPRRTLDTWG